MMSDPDSEVLIGGGTPQAPLTTLIERRITGRPPALPVGPGPWWSHYDWQERPGYETATFDGFEDALADASGHSGGPIGTFRRGYSGNNFPATFQESSVADAPLRGLGAVINVKCDWEMLAYGGMDDTIRSFFESWPAGTFGSFTVNHEPENDQPVGNANPVTNPDYLIWAREAGPLWSRGIARAIRVAAPIIRARGLDVKLGGCLMDFSWDTSRWMSWRWWDYVDPDFFDVVEFQLDAYVKTVDGSPPYGYDLIPRLEMCLQAARDVGIYHWSLLETANDRRERHGGDNMVGNDESVAVWWEDYAPRVAAIPGARTMTYFSIPTGPASAQAGLYGRGLEVFADICLNGRRP